MLLSSLFTLLPLLGSSPDLTPKIGDPAPELALHPAQGVATDWAELRGKVCVLEFWATWCSPCIPALKHLGEVQAALAGEDVVFLGISPEAPERMERFLARNEVAFPTLLDVEDATFGAYAVRVVPTTIVVDREGRISARTRPDRLTEDVLRRVLAGEPAGLEVVRDVESNIAWEPADSDEGEVFARLVIAPSESTSGGSRFSPGSGKITADGIHRDNMIQLAYDVPHTRVASALSPWSREDPVYKLSVLAPGGDDALARRMLARAIEVKFQFTARFEEREADALILAWLPDAEPWKESEAAESAWKGSAYGGGVDYVGQPIESACRWFENITRKPVVDDTGLDGRYDLKLEWVDGDSFQAELARVGLQLIPERLDVRMLVVEPRG